MIELRLAGWRPLARTPRARAPRGYRVEVLWTWGSGGHPALRETYRFHVIDVEEIEPRVRNYVIPHIVKGHAFDCGRRDHPLNPWIYGIDVTPVDETQHFPTGRYADAMKVAIARRAAECRK